MRTNEKLIYRQIIKHENFESKNTYRNNKQETETTTEDLLKAMATTTTEEDEGKRKTNLPNKFGADK